MKTAPAPREVRNPWHKPGSAYSKPTYSLKGEPILSHRGVDVYRAPSSGYVYVFGDMAITCRSSYDTAADVIDGILNGTGYVTTQVAEFLRGNGFPAVSWDEADDEEVA